MLFVDMFARLNVFLGYCTFADIGTRTINNEPLHFPTKDEPSYLQYWNLARYLPIHSGYTHHLNHPLCLCFALSNPLQAPQHPNIAAADHSAAWPSQSVAGWVSWLSAASASAVSPVTSTGVTKKSGSFNVFAR